MSTKVRHQQDTVLGSFRTEGPQQGAALVLKGGREVALIVRHYHTHIWVPLQSLAHHPIILHLRQAACAAQMQQDSCREEPAEIREHSDLPIIVQET